MADDYIETVGDVILRSLTHLGVVSYGDAPEGGTMRQCMNTLNRMLGSWINTSFGIISQTKKSEVLKSGSGEIALEGFYNIRGDLILSHNSAETYPERVNPSDLNIGKVIKGTPKVYSIQWEERKNSKGNIVIFTVFNFMPLPSHDFDVSFYTDSKIPRYKHVSDPFLFPDSWVRAAEYNLCSEIAADFGLSVPVEIKKIANESRDMVRIMCYRSYPFNSVNDLPVRTF